MQKISTICQKAPWTLGLALFFFVGSLFTLLVWIPVDIETGVIERYRSRVTIGDAFAPTVMAVGMLVTSVLMAIIAIVHPSSTKEGLDQKSFSFIFRLIGAIGISLVIMIHAGPLLVDLVNALGGEVGTYRNLRATYPYKIFGYILGGFILIFGCIGVVENRFTISGAGVSLIAVIVLTILYEVPFDNFLLPPNGNG